MVGHKKWLRLTLEGPSPLLETISEAFLGRGALGAWQQKGVTHLYFPPEFNPVEVRSALRLLLSHFGDSEQGLHFELTWEEERDWLAYWRSHFRPVPIGHRILVKPPWYTVPPAHAQRDILIEIEPATAFGTGTHPSTQLSLEALERYVTHGCQVLDVGTGSGILAIAAAKLGSRRVLGFDVDPLAIDNARGNLLRNRTADRVHLFVGTVDAVKPVATWDVVVANIQRHVLLDLLDDLVARLARQGLLILAGLIETEQEEMTSEMARRRLQIVECLRREEWIAIVARTG